MKRAVHFRTALQLRRLRAWGLYYRRQDSKGRITITHVVAFHHISPAGVGAEFSNFKHVIDALLIQLRLEFRYFFLQGPCL
jgi:hypothetical protein